jgi:hypothetical protein
VSTFIIPDKAAVTSIDPIADVFPVWHGAAQKKATATNIVASAGTLLLDTNTTFNVAASGGGFTTVQAALDNLNNYTISPRCEVDIVVAAGTYTHTAPIIKDGPFGMYTFIKGVVYTKNVTSIQSSSGSTGAWSIVLNMDSVANIAVNDYIGFILPTGGTLPSYLAGCHKITNVDAVNTRITILSTHKATTAPSGAVASAGTVFKSILSFSAMDGIRIWSGASTLNLQDICIVGTATVGTNGLSLQDGGGRLFIAGNVGVVGFQYGVYGTYNVELNGDGNIIVSSCQHSAYVADQGATMTSGATVASGCGSYGFNASNGGAILALNGTSTGHTLDGAIAQNGGLVNVSTCTMSGNGRWGIYSDTNSVCFPYNSTFSNNVRGDYSSKSFSGLDGNSVFSEQSYGYNNIATPNGHNLFVGYGAGSANCGSTATTTTQSSANVAIGQYPLSSITTGYMNVGIGYAAGEYITTGNDNTAVGANAGKTITGGSTHNITSTTSVYLGSSTKAKADGGANEIVIGYNTTGNGSNTTTIGNSSTTLAQIYGALAYASPVTMPGGRLTLATATPVMMSTVSGATTVYYTPYKGRTVPIYNGSLFLATDTGGELSQTTTDATKSPAAVGASSVYDMFIWNDSGTIRCTRGPAWTNTTTRSAGTALTLLNGVLVNNAAITNGPAQYQGTYVGTIASNASSTIDWILGTAASGGGAANLMVWNYYNRVNTITRVTDSGVTYTYQTATVRQARGSTANQINYLAGVAEDAPVVSYQQAFTLVGAVAATVQIGVGDDSITAFETVPGQFYTNVAVAATGTCNTTYQKGFGEPMLGIHYAAALEKGDGTNANTFNVGTQGELSFSFLM